MNWTSRTPIEGVKCIVETEGCVFPAHYINETWWNTEKGFPIERVKRWVVYPEGEDPNDYIAPEVLLKYVMQSYRESQSKLKAVKGLNQELCNTFSKVRKENENLKRQNEKMKEELKTTRKESKKLKSLFDKFFKVFKQASMINVQSENINEEEFVA